MFGKRLGLSNLRRPGNTVGLFALILLLVTGCQTTSGTEQQATHRLSPRPCMKRSCLAVRLEISGLTEGCVDRDVTFAITNCSGAADRRLEETVTFTATPHASDPVGVGHVILKNVDVDAQWLSAQEGHTLRRLMPIESSPDGILSVDFAGKNKLLSGDLQTDTAYQDNLVDILDFSILASHWEQSVDPDSAKGADVTGDGYQDSGDFAVMQANFFEVGDPEDGCGGISVPDHLKARTSIKVAELAKMLPNASRADLTGDGTVDSRDIHAFAERHQLRLTPEFERKLR